MSITVGSRGVAEVTVPAVQLRRILGAIELIFSLNVRVLPHDPLTHEALLWGADIKTRAAGAQTRLGLARLARPIRLRPTKFEQNVQVELVFPLTVQQLDLLEGLRAGGDLWFGLSACAEGREGPHEQSVFNEWNVQVPRSQWIAQLKSCGAQDILLLEVPLPAIDQPEKLRKALDLFRDAQRQLANGEFGPAVAVCRQVLEVLGTAEFAATILDGFTKGRRGQGTQERADLIAAAVYNYTHPAHHVPAGAGDDYSSADARFALITTAAVLAHRWGKA